MIGAFISIIFGLSSMYVWDNSQNALVDTRDDMLLSYMIYCVGFAISIAITFPKSECYFLRVEGPIKAMDIAIYKWINAIFHNRQFTIGKSINCDLQITWDLPERYRPGNRRSENEGWTSLPHCLGRGRFYSKERNETQRKDTALPRYPFPYRANKIHLHRTRYLMLATVQPPINQTVCHAQFTGDFR